MNALQEKIDQVITVLTNAVRDYAPVTFANSLGAEDMVLTDMINRNHLDIEMFSLDTGRLPQETYDLMQQVKRNYHIPLQIFFPEATRIEEYAAQHGVNAFYDNVELRKLCCHIRKVEPLGRALRGKRAWVTGLRREQAVTRYDFTEFAYDEDHQMQKISPLIEWSSDQIWQYIKQNDVPYNKLHDQFYPSIGCAPCSRAVTPGEDFRAGRWWWELSKNKECGLHVEKTALIK